MTEKHKRIVLHGRKVVGGVVEGEALVSKRGIECWFGLDRDTGTITEWKHPLKGRSIKGKILVFPFHRGSSAWGRAFSLNYLKGNGPLAMVIWGSDWMVITAAVLTGTPLVTELNEDPCQVIESGNWVRVNADRGVVEVYKKKV